MNTNQGLTSPDRRYRLTMQGDGNLVLYGPAGPSWATGTASPYAYTVVQGDGNIVTYDRTDGSVLWTSSTFGLYTQLEVQNDGTSSSTTALERRSGTLRATVGMPPSRAGDESRLRLTEPGRRRVLTRRLLLDRHPG
jgi:hypothetical protein